MQSDDLYHFVTIYFIFLLSDLIVHLTFIINLRIIAKTYDFTQ